MLMKLSPDDTFNILAVEYSIINNKEGNGMKHRLELCSPENYIFWDFSEFIRVKHYFGLLYNHVVNNGPNPDDKAGFCHFLLQNHVSIVRVEMATKSIIRFQFKGETFTKA
jgi:hypothetical protein